MMHASVKHALLFMIDKLVTDSSLEDEACFDDKVFRYVTLHSRF